MANVTGRPCAGAFPSGRSPFVTIKLVPLKKPQALLLSLAITAVLGGCAKKEDTAQAVAPAAKTDSALILDESKLPPVNRFAIGDLDTSKDACVDFGGYVNSKWLAANAIPGDRTSWGAFEMLGERSKAVQRQLAEQAAAKTDATGVEKIVGDIFATGMDAEKINAQGLEPIKSRRDAIASLDSPDPLADYLRTRAATGATRC